MGVVQNREVLAYEKMDQLSQGFGPAVLLAFPNWERLAKDVEDENTGCRYIEVDVPQEGSDRPLHLSTADNDGVWIESSLEYLVAPSPPKPNSITQVFSWRCTYDRTIETP